MKHDFKVAICTKGRYDTKYLEKLDKMSYAARMIGLIYDHAINFDMSELDRVFLFVEPQDAENYAKNYPDWPKSNIIVIGGNDQGISFARQSVLEYFQNELPSELVFMMDDDLSLLEYQWGYNSKKETYEYLQVQRNDVLQLLDEFIQYQMELPEWDKVGIASFDYNQFGWTNVGKFPQDGSLDTCREGKIYTNFTHSDCCVMLRPLLYKELGIIYDGQAPLKEDRDFNAQVLYHGYYARKPFRYLMVSPLNGTNKGGCGEFYKRDGYCMRSCEYLVRKWNVAYPKAELCKIKDKNTSYNRTFDVKWYWQRFWHARVRNLITQEVVTEYVFPDTIKNRRTYANFMEEDA